MEDYSFITSSMTYSFSRINGFAGNSCRHEWKRHYIDCEEGVQSFDGETGGTAHHVLEAYFKGEITEWDMPTMFSELIEKEVVHPCPYPSGDSKTPKIMEYFETFSFDKDKYEILGVEKKIEFKLKDKYPIIGFIDLLLRERETGKIILVDHKTSTIKQLKNGKISKSDEEHWLAFQRQQLLYSYVVLQEYGRVDRLSWNMIKDGTVLSIDWTEQQMNDTLEWAYNSIQDIEKETEFPATYSSYFCNNLCSVRENYCPYKRLGNMYGVIKSNCYNPKNERFQYYGAIGIEICEEWLEDMNNFFKWSLENGYGDDLILNRHDEFGPYSPENCYWDAKDDVADYCGYDN